MQEAFSVIAQAFESSTITLQDAESLPAIPLVTPEVESGGQRLTELLSNQPEQPVYAIDPATAPSDATGGSNTLGEKILSRLDAVGKEFRSNMERVHTMLEVGPGKMSLENLLGLQMEMAQVGLEIELVSKGIQKAVQHTEQLTKLQ